jgi:hypothetical protein
MLIVRESSACQHNTASRSQFDRFAFSHELDTDDAIAIANQSCCWRG